MGAKISFDFLFFSDIVGIVMNSYASVVENAIKIESPYEMDGEHWFKVSCPGGWDEVQKLSKKVLRYENRNYVWTGWNSDKNESYFKSSGQFAKF